MSELGQRGITNQPTHQQHQGNIDHHYEGNMIVDCKKYEGQKVQRFDILDPFISITLNKSRLGIMTIMIINDIDGWWQY